MKINLKEKHIRALRFELIDYSFYFKGKEHPLLNMKNLGINIIAAVPETIGDCWFVLTDFQCELPEYIDEIKLNKSYWERMCDIEFIE